MATNVTVAVLCNIGAPLAAEATMPLGVAWRREEPMRIHAGGVMFLPAPVRNP
jgi:hypothetical protein